MKRGVLIFWLLIIVLIVAGVGASFTVKSGPGQLDSFTQCLKEKGAIFYGAFWCQHCQKTKAMFGRSAKLLPYVECSTAGGKGQTSECKAKNITNYPTWVFANSTTTLTGVRTLQELSVASGCPLPL